MNIGSQSECLSHFVILVDIMVCAQDYCVCSPVEVHVGTPMCMAVVVSSLQCV